ncbi:hypothetical protein NC653_031838 [Populus alba x Populus x berolinensis]|uniref:Uncharacterized protein n=1 Tax=Populus alba x Populus x berolinensis TaxID=444605 RepID=A0AAD6Q372_9ROSI|nr:hypothetical protein NC653_031838 [Populus alba x Populus x berolinensis]
MTRVLRSFSGDCYLKSLVLGAIILKVEKINFSETRESLQEVYVPRKVISTRNSWHGGYVDLQQISATSVPHAVGCKSRMAGSCPCRRFLEVLWIRLSSRRRYAYAKDETAKYGDSRKRFATLYPPVAVVSREAFKEMKFGGITNSQGCECVDNWC